MTSLFQHLATRSLGINPDEPRMSSGITEDQILDGYHSSTSPNSVRVTVSEQEAQEIIERERRRRPADFGVSVRIVSTEADYL